MQKGQGVDGSWGKKPYESDVADATTCRHASCCKDKSVKTHIFREFSPRADTSQGEWLHGQMRDKKSVKNGCNFPARGGCAARSGRGGRGGVCRNCSFVRSLARGSVHYVAIPLKKWKLEISKVLKVNA